MSTNKDLARQLEAMRLKAKEVASQPAVTEVPAAEPVTPVPVASPPTQNIATEPPAELKEVPRAIVPDVKAKGRGGAPRRPPVEIGLERTSVSLKPSDTEALAELQAFIMKRVRKASPISTLIRLAIVYTTNSLKSDPETLALTYQAVLENDGRRQVDR